MIEFGKRISFLILLLSFTGLNAQKANENADYLTWFDIKVGNGNTPLFNGFGYVEPLKSINKNHKFFASQDFLDGSVLYNGQAYHGLKMKYDVYADEVAIDLENGFDLILLRPEKKKIQSFIIDGKNFENIYSPDVSDPEISGYFEVLFSSPVFTLYKKHRKKRSKKIGDKLVYYEYQEDNFHVLSYGGTYTLVSSNRDFRKLFPEFKIELKNIASKNRTGIIA